MSDEVEWKHSVKATQENFQRLQELDAALNEEQVAVENIERTLSAQRRGSVSRANTFNSRIIAAKNNSANIIANSSAVSGSATKHTDKDLLNSMADIYGDTDPQSPEHDVTAAAVRPTSARKGSSLMANPMNGFSSPTGPEKVNAPETADRFSRAKVQLLAKQLNDANELRVKMEEQVKGLQKQLNTAREENKTSTKRYSFWMFQFSFRQIFTQ